MDVKLHGNVRFYFWGNLNYYVKGFLLNVGVL